MSISYAHAIYLLHMNVLFCWLRAGTCYNSKATQPTNVTCTLWTWHYNTLCL